MANNNKKKVFTKLVNRVKYFAKKTVPELEKTINRFLEESAGNFVTQPIVHNLPPHNSADEMFCAMVQYTLKVPVDDNTFAEEEVESETATEDSKQQ